MNNTKCQLCHAHVTDAVDGDVGPAAPWADETETSAIHWRCENEALLAHEQDQVRAQLSAAERSGR